MTTNDTPCGMTPSWLSADAFAALTALQHRVYRAVNITNGPWIGSGDKARDTTVLCHLLTCDPCWRHLCGIRQRKGGAS